MNTDLPQKLDNLLKQSERIIHILESQEKKRLTKRHIIHGALVKYGRGYAVYIPKERASLIGLEEGSIVEIKEAR